MPLNHVDLFANDLSVGSVNADLIGWLIIEYFISDLAFPIASHTFVTQACKFEYILTSIWAMHGLVLGPHLLGFRSDASVVHIRDGTGYKEATQLGLDL